jgi:type II secretory pathway pseudopilin PulG
MIEKVLSNKIMRLVVIFVLLALVLATSFYSWQSAKKTAQSRRVAKDSQAIRSGLEYFYKDQNRYPSTIEFQDANLMSAYISNYPPLSFPTEECPQNFDYFNPSPFSYELRICLQKSVGAFHAGINKFTEKP